MFVTDHVLAGAVLGLALRRPALAFPVGVASHFVLDSCPHFDPNGGHLLAYEVADGFAGLAVMGVAVVRAPRRLRPAVLAGMVGAALPDLDKPCRLFFGGSPFPAWFDHVHSAIQHEYRALWPLELAVALALVTAYAKLTAPTSPDEPPPPPPSSPPPFPGRGGATTTRA